MVTSGYPDYQRVAFGAGAQLYNQTKAYTATGYVMTAAPCMNYQSLSIFFSSPVGSDFYQIYVVFFADAAASVIIAQPFWVVGPNFRSTKSVPVEGPYFALFVTPKAGGNNTSVTLAAYGASSNLSSITWDAPGQPMLDVSPSLATNASQLLTATVGVEGPATIAFDTSNTKNYRCAILYYDFGSGAFKNLYLFYGADIGRGAIENVQLPLTPLQWYIQNTDAATQTVSMRAVAGIAGVP